MYVIKSSSCSQNFQSNTTFVFWGEPPRTLLTKCFSFVIVSALRHCKCKLNGVFTEAWVKCYSDLVFRGFKKGLFFLWKLQLRWQILLVINCKISRCAVRAWRDVINEFEIRPLTCRRTASDKLHINVPRKICQIVVFKLVYKDMNKTYILIISNRSEY